MAWPLALLLTNAAAPHPGGAGASLWFAINAVRSLPDALRWQKVLKAARAVWGLDP